VLEAAQSLVHKALDLLSPRERDIIAWHYGLGGQREPMTLDQIGKQFGVTKERVRQIERKAMLRLRSQLDAASARALLQSDAHG
jgi:RNA polymerase sigma factor (sigma-70 family)